MYKFERILCATDFSPASLFSLRFASHLMHKLGGLITLFYVDEFETSPYGKYKLTEKEKDQHRRTVESFAKEKFQEALRSANLPDAKTNHIIRFGTAYKEIIDEAESGTYSVVVLSTQGLGNSSPHLIGRTAERVVRICRAPVLTLRPSEGKDTNTVKTILCPTDFSEYGNYALPYAISMANQLKAKLILLHVTDLNVSNPEKLVHKFPNLSLYHDLNHDTIVERVVGRDVEPENTIVQTILEHDVDMVVIGTHGARGLRRVQIGNTTEEIVRRVEVPVLSITHPIHRMVFPRRFSEDYEANDEVK